MTRKILTAIVMLTLSLTMAMAQDNAQEPESSQAQVAATPQERSITGLLIDKEEQEPVIQATVQLLKAADSSYVAGAVSDLDGAFTLKAPENGKYILKITNIGYKTVTRNVTIAGDKPFAFGKINLETDAVLLKEVVANGVAAKVIVKEDTFIYNAAAYRTPEGSVIEELVKRLPGAQIDDDGKITINGKEVKKIKVDGKEFMTGDTQTALKNLPTAIIDKVKAYDEKSDMAKLTGVDDGEEETILDFNIKKGMNKGILANIDLSIGTKSRYAEQGMFGWMKENSRLFIFGSANNTGDRRFGPGRGGGNGLTATKSAGTDIGWDNGKKENEAGRLELGGNLRWEHNNTDRQSRSNSEMFLGSGSSSSFSNSLSQQYSRSTSFNSGLSLRWKPDTLTMVMFFPNFSYSDGDNWGQSRTATFNSDPYAIDGVSDPLNGLFSDSISALRDIAVNTNHRRSLSHSRSTSANYWGMVVRNLNNKGRNISLSSSGNFSNSKNDSYSRSDINYFQTSARQKNQFTNQYIHDPQKSWSLGGRLSYSEPLT